VTLSEFKGLAKHKQIKVARQYGVLLICKTGEHFTAHLYQLDGFYIDICFKEQIDEILLIRSFMNPDSLLPYLDEIDISGVFQ
jgi:hypothetical protein